MYKQQKNACQITFNLKKTKKPTLFSLAESETN